MGHFKAWLSRRINYPLVRPERIQISLTYRCNLRCKMCSIVNLLPQEEELSTGQVFKIIEESKNYKIKEVLLTGGEPFLRKDIFDICAYCRTKGLSSIITTNGTLVDEDLSDGLIRSGASHIHFSLDGLEQTNDFFRGNGSFKKIIKGIETLNKARAHNHSFSLGVACTVMDKNVEELFEIVKLADNLNIDVINFQPLIKDNKNFLDNNISNFWLNEEHIPILKEKLRRIREYKPRHINIYEEPHLELLIKYYKRELTRKDWVCFGGFKTVFICYSKNQPLVYSCHGICGNLNNVSLKKAWISKEAHKLRIHSKRCPNLCIQSCYSQESAQSLSNIQHYIITKKG